MRADNPLRALKDSDRLLITPHIGWGSIEARTLLMEMVLQHIQEFLEETGK